LQAGRTNAKVIARAQAPLLALRRIFRRR